jgi:outer membrane protein assembly factor BamB
VSVDAPRCPECGAALPPRRTDGTYHCDFCGKSFDSRQTAARQAVVPPRPHVYSYVPTYQPPKTRALPLAIFASVGVMMAIGALAFLVSAKRAHVPAYTPPAIPDVSAAIEAAESQARAVTANHERLFFDDVGGPPIPLGDGVLARFRGNDDQLTYRYLSADGKEHWHTPLLGTYSDGEEFTHAAIAGGKVLVTDFHSKVHAFDLDTGAETGAFDLADKAKQICASPDGKQAWLAVVDEKPMLLDPATGKLTKTSRPRWCPELDFFGRQELSLSRPDVDGMELDAVLVDGPDGVALGHKHPGSRLPMLAGYDPKTLKVRWTSPLAADDPATVADAGGDVFYALGGGRWASTYSLNRGGAFVVGFDAKTGTRLWTRRATDKEDDTRSPDQLATDGTHFYVGFDGDLTVLDGATGTVVSEIKASY